MKKKYFYTYEESDEAGKGASDLAKILLEDPELSQVTDITIGHWGECYDSSCQSIIDMIVENKEKFVHVKAIAFGDMGYEECEVSWIMQGDYGDLFAALPNLEKFWVKGQNGLKLGENIVHAQLKHLEIVCGGLDKTVLAEINGASLPNLETLILYIGQEGYGFNGSIDDIKPLISKNKFPKLKYLGLVNSEIADEIVELVLESNLLAQLEVVAFSYGTLTDKGAQLLLDNQDSITHLRTLDLHWHYISEEVTKKLEALPIEVKVSDPQQEDEYNGEIYRYSMLGE